MHRRTVLAAAGAMVPLAGCTGVLRSDSVEPEPEYPEARCAEAEQETIVNEVDTDSLEGFTMSVDPAEIEHGDAITVSLTNENDETRITGTRHKFTIHRRHQSEWESVFTEDEHSIWDAVGISHEPGDGFTWELTVSREGFAAAENRLEPCAAVRPGTYRFVYWGVDGERERETDYEREYGIGAVFTVVK